LYFIVDVRGGRNRDAVRDAVLLGVAPGIDEAAFGLAGSESETEVDAGPGCGLDLSEDVLAKERHHRAAGARLHIIRDSESEVQELVIQGTEARFPAAEHSVDVLFGGGTVCVGSESSA